MKHDGEKELQPVTDVLLRYKAPVTAVKADVAVVAHCEDAVRRHNQLSILYVRRQSETPLRSDIFKIAGRQAGEVVAIAVVRTVADYVRLVQFFTVAVDHPIHQTDAVSGNPNHTLNDVKPGRGR